MLREPHWDSRQGRHRGDSYNSRCQETEGLKAKGNNQSGSMGKTPELEGLDLHDVFRDLQDTVSPDGSTGASNGHCLQYLQSSDPPSIPLHLGEDRQTQPLPRYPVFPWLHNICQGSPLQGLIVRQTDPGTEQRGGPAKQLPE